MAKIGSTFLMRHRISKLVHFEIYSDAYTAISREKELKRWRRSKKIALIESANPDWRDLAIDWGIERTGESATLTKDPSLRSG